MEKRAFENRFRLPFAPVEAVLERIARMGYARCDDGRWHLTPEGFLISNAIILQVLEVLNEEKRRRMEAAHRGDFRIVP